MSLDKAIIHKKEHRKEYRGAKAVDVNCRNHGDCDYCKNNRLFSRKKQELRFILDIENYKKGEMF